MEIVIEGWRQVVKNEKHLGLCLLANYRPSTMKVAE
jgi:hypothetical protein